MKSVFTGHGWARIDNTESGGQLLEDDILGCKHCQALLHGHDWRADGGFCCVCDGPICNSCRDRTRVHGCEVFQKQVDTALNDLYRREQNAKVLGV